MSDVQFAAPEWTFVFWCVLAVVALLFWLERRGGRALARFVGPALQERLVVRSTRLRRGLRLGLLGLAGVALVLALMRPQWGVEFITAPQVGAEIMIALDVSKSMLAEDVAPNRLERAKAEIRDLLTYLDGDQVGLIAFAGRASVLSPLTPDFGFLRLVLDNVDVGTVRRGGTRLEEPIRKATQGFGGSGDLSRVILLITDGEDHDSFALDAAEEAAERGIRIIAIGFGDEDGSEIILTDPQNGARTVLRDADGRPVISRLDGDLLRELAVVTEGAYVPAGTGVLDLESIFEAHIRPLMRGTGEERGKTIRKDGYQWFILVALLALLGSAATHATRSSLLVALVILAQTPLADVTRAQPPAPPNDPGALSEERPPGEVETGDEGSEGRERLELPEDPRESFNRGLEGLESGSLEDAERLFEAARSGSRGDAEVRFRATYNQGWIEVERAESAMDAEPEAALASLRRAADWFREAIALKPKNQEARRNLEIVLARALVLADSLADRAPRDVDARLDELIEAQRAAATGIREAVDRAHGIDDAEVAEALGPHFKRLAVEERKILSLGSSLSELAGDERDTLEGMTEEERTPEDNMRRAQLEGVLHYLHRARERIGQARSQLRQRQPERAYRRAAAGLANLKRARDQLLDPVQVLDGVIGDTARLAGETRVLASVRLGPALESEAEADSAVAPAPHAPAWLNSPYLAETQDAIRQRTDELDARFSAGLSAAEGIEDPEQLAVLEQVGEAQPHVSAASGHFGGALEALHADRPMEALQLQSAALSELIRARERFLDLKRLIEVAYEDEKRIGGFLSPEEGLAAEQIAEFGPALMQAQEQNLERLKRMTPMVEREREKLRAELDAQPEGEGTEGPQALERLELADGILALSESAMTGAMETLAELGAGEEAMTRSRESVATATRGLEALRRLFFSIVEHIRDAAERQIELGDETEAVASSEPDRAAEKIGPIASRQEELAVHTDGLAEALHQQSLADPAELLGPEAVADEAAAAEATAKLIQASEFVLFAGSEMTSAGEALDAEPRDVASIRLHQTTAVENLAEALALLQPPQQPQDQQEQGDEQEQQQQEGQQQEQQAQQEREPEPSSDPAQLLQSVRDREAERHRNPRERKQRGSEPVAKDW